MELLEGQVLSERLGSGALTSSEAIHIGLGILAALSALHARGIVHRDLKPSNVFLTQHGVKVLDFGLARPEFDAAFNPTTELTRPGVVMGTPRYMAPEQITGEQVDGRSDLFAVGAILFEMLAGRPAFAGRTFVEIIHATQYEQPPALTGSPRSRRSIVRSGERWQRVRQIGLRRRRPWPRNCGRWSRPETIERQYWRVHSRGSSSCRSASASRSRN